MKTSEADPTFVKNAIDAAAKIFLIGVLLSLSYSIIKPFVMPVLWAIIIAVAFYPLITRITKMLGGRRKLACILFIIVSVGVLIIPVIVLAESSVDVAKRVAGDLKNNEVSFIKEAPERVAEIPVVGQKISDAWNFAATDLKGAIKAAAPATQDFARHVLNSIGAGLKTVLQFVISFIIAGILMMNPEGGYSVTRKLGRSFAGKKGDEFTDLSIATIRGVMTGVVGVAVIQAVLGTIGMVVMGIPAAGLWGLLVLICAIIQLPPIIILGPIAAYAFSQYNTTPAIIFLVWSLLVSASDGVLKPVLMARGVDTPMLVILIGAIGGMMMSGIVGLFVGAVILSITYAIFMAWVNEKQEAVEVESSGDEVEGELAE